MTSVIISFQIEGMHCWPEAKDVFPDVGFLSDPHRHMFHFKMAKKVNHNDRDVEFIRWKREVKNYLTYKYAKRIVESESLYIDNTYLDFGRMSCEDIATELFDVYNCLWVEVFEDGENGSRVDND